MATISELYDRETEVSELGIDVPSWIDQDIDTAQVAAIVEGGCASGAYMPAVTYYRALETMGEHGDDVMQYIANECGDVPGIPPNCSWSGYACHCLSIAVEIWAGLVADEIEFDEE